MIRVHLSSQLNNLNLNCLESDEETKTRLEWNNDLKSMTESRDAHNYHADQQQSWNVERITPVGKGNTKKSIKTGDGSK